MRITPEVLLDLKKGILLTGRLSEVHVSNLKTYPFVFFDHVETVSVSYDIITDTTSSLPGVGSKIRYEITFKEGYDPDLLDHRVKALANSVKTLLWNNVDVYVFDSKGKELK